MYDSIMRPVMVSPGLVGKPAPCDFFDARGTLLLREGGAVSPTMGEQQGSRRLYCRASQAGRVSSGDPLRTLRHVGKTLAALDELATAGGSATASDFRALAEEAYAVWTQDPDACIGYARIVQFDRPSVCHAILSALFAAELGSAHGFAKPEVIELLGAALTMNLGSMDLHDRMSALVGKPGVEDRKALDLHPACAEQLLVAMGGFPERWLVAVAQHHENFDGSGYPTGFMRGEIELHARMLRLADMLAARLGERKRRGPQYWSLHQARDPERLIRHIFGTDMAHLDATLVRLLMGRLSSFPPGSVVRLSNGEMAVISRRSPDPGAAPRQVLAFLDADGRPQHAPQTRQIGPGDCRISSYAHDDQPRLPPYDWQAIWGYHAQMASPAGLAN